MMFVVWTNWNDGAWIGLVDESQFPEAGRWTRASAAEHEGDFGILPIAKIGEIPDKVWQHWQHNLNETSGKSFRERESVLEIFTRGPVDAQTLGSMLGHY